MSERIRDSYDDALYKSTYTITLLCDGSIGSISQHVSKPNEPETARRSGSISGTG